MHKLYFLFFNFQEILKENTYRSCPWYIKMYEGILFKFYYLRQEIHLYKVHLILTYCMCLGIYTRYFILCIQLVIHVQFSTVVYCTHTCEGIYYFFNIRKAPLRGFLSKTRTKKMDFDFCRTTGPCLASATADMNGGELKLTDMVRRCLDVM